MILSFLRFSDPFSFIDEISEHLAQISLKHANFAHHIKITIDIPFTLTFLSIALPPFPIWSLAYS